MKRTTMLVVCALALVLCTGSAWAQLCGTEGYAACDTLKVDYFSNANTSTAPDGTVRIDNPGTYWHNDLCAAIYVFDAAQELSECCSCLETPDGLRTLSVNGDLTKNPLTGITLTGGLIKIVSTLPAYVNHKPYCPTPTSLSPYAGLRAWATHIQNVSFAITETNSQDATLSDGEESALAGQCASIVNVGSGSGICSCGTGD